MTALTQMPAHNLHELEAVMAIIEWAMLFIALGLSADLLVARYRDWSARCRDQVRANIDSEVCAVTASGEGPLVSAARASIAVAELPGRAGAAPGRNDRKQLLIAPRGTANSAFYARFAVLNLVGAALILASWVLFRLFGYARAPEVDTPRGAARW